MPKAYPQEFCEDVVRIARQGELTYAQIARDFGISESCLARWLKMDDIEEGRRPGVSQAESAQLREANKRIRLLEQENEVLRRAAVYLGRGVNSK
jgi:transposase